MHIVSYTALVGFHPLLNEGSQRSLVFMLSAPLLRGVWNLRLYDRDRRLGHQVRWSLWCCICRLPERGKNSEVRQVQRCVFQAGRFRAELLGLEDLALASGTGLQHKHQYCWKPGSEQHQCLIWRRNRLRISVSPGLRSLDRRRRCKSLLHGSTSIWTRFHGQHRHHGKKRPEVSLCSSESHGQCS